MRPGRLKRNQHCAISSSKGRDLGTVSRRKNAKSDLENFRITVRIWAGKVQETREEHDTFFASSSFPLEWSKHICRNQILAIPPVAVHQGAEKVTQDIGAALMSFSRLCLGH